MRIQTRTKSTIYILFIILLLHQLANQYCSIKYCQLTMAVALAPFGNKGFADSYMFLNPEDAHFFDIFRILFSRNIGHRKFVHSNSEGSVEESFRKRWLIFVSIVLQKIMILFAKPLAYLGSCIEMFINLVSLNGGIFMIILNFLTGQLVFFQFILFLLFYLYVVSNRLSW